MPKIRFPLPHLFLAVSLVLPCACGGEKKENVPREEKRDSYVSPLSKANALVIWTPVDPRDPVSRAFEELVEGHNTRNPNQNVALLFLPEEDFDRRTARLEREEIPPDLFIAPDRRILEMARASLLLPVGDLLAEAKVDRADAYPVAWRAVEADGKVWGLPVCADLRLCFVNVDRMAEGGLTTDALNAAPEERADWEMFRKGGALQVEEDFGRLIELAESSDRPSFRWVAFTRVGERKVAEDSLSFLTVAVAKRTMRSVKEMFPFWRASQSPAMAFIFRAKGRRVPVLCREEKTREFLKSVPIRGPWLEDF